MGILKGRHALVTGGGTGIGAAIAEALGGQGARISLAGRRREPLEATAARLTGACVIEADVTREEDTATMVARARAEHGAIDIVVANAGAAESRPAARIDRDHWQRMLDVNLTGAFLTVQSALADLTRAGAQDGGRRVVLVSSTAGLKGYSYVAAYCAAKHGAVGLMRALAAELAPTGVTVNAVCPGFTDTPLLEASIANIVAKTGRSEAEARKALSAGNPQGRFVKPEEVAAAVLWLASPAAASVTGQAISISGGEV
jgi:NAD(P)-dependent dehydrogenase (short-subunit alcohol dehydrogenase family)